MSEVTTPNPEEELPAPDDPSDPSDTPQEDDNDESASPDVAPAPEGE